MIGCGVTVGDIIYDEIIIFYFFYGYDEYEIDYDYTDYGLYYCNDLPEYYYFALYAEIGLYLDAEDGRICEIDSFGVVVGVYDLFYI